MNLPAFLGPFQPLPQPPGIASTPTGGSAPSRTLPIVMQPQQGQFWCWAATSTSVSLFYDSQSGWTQCGVATACLSQPCCSQPAPCDVPWSLDAPLGVTGNLQTHFSGTLSRAQIQSEIDASRPVCCFIDWNDNSGHFVTIAGYDWGTDDVFVDDPLRERQTVPYDIFVSSYQGSGRWTYSYLTEA